MSYFLLARSFENLNDTLSALQNYIKAKDLDYNPFRAVTDFNNSLKKIAAADPNVKLFDAEKLFQKYGHRGIPGFDLFLDYVHPAREGNILLASELSEFIRKRNLLDIGGSEISTDRSTLRDLLSGYSDENDVALQVIRFSLCCLTHQYHSAVNFGRNILENLQADYLNNPANSNDIHKLRDGVSCFTQYLDAENMAFKDSNKNQELLSAKAVVHKFYDTYYPYGTY